MPRRVFLLSPASTTGKRAQILLREEARFELALAVRSREGAPLGEVFAFLSGLYFRGKLAYATRFAPGAAYVITASSGLVPPDARVRHGDLRRHARVPIDASADAFRRPLERDARRLRSQLDPDGEVVLLGSIATDKYVATLLEAFGPRLLFPPDFVGRGDMSRGGLLLRAARAGRELTYAPVAGAVRHGKRPPKLDPATRVRG
ncbi:MAG TPA: hypothetical protein VKG23_16615 [Thermoanaerobaculia bacterium]|nr:hypothetical protein [Thermoanaerobaculia bacterium]